MRSKEHAIIVEDEYLIAADLQDALRRLGFKVCGVAADGDTARSLAIKHLPTVVLMDVCLEGGREGIEIARWIAEACGASIVFVTANTDRDTVSRIQERVPGAPVLAKPLDRRALPDAIGQARRASEALASASPRVLQ
jgi:DNA-binding response OmpR family regulator